MQVPTLTLTCPEHLHLEGAPECRSYITTQEVTNISHFFPQIPHKFVCYFKTYTHRKKTLPSTYKTWCKVHISFFFFLPPPLFPPAVPGQRGPRRHAVHAIFRDGEFQQTARQSPLGGYGRCAAKKGRNPSCSRRGQAADEVGRFIGPSPACLEANDDEAASGGLLEVGVDVVAFPPSPSPTS